MPLFRKAEPEPAVTGVDILRGKTRNYTRSPQGHSLLKETLHLSSSDLEKFANGGELSLEQLRGLAGYFFPHSELGEDGLLRSKAPPARPLCAGGYPGPSPINLPSGYVPGPTGAPPPASVRSAPDPRVGGTSRKTAGWA